jgi:uroporphyrinogen-III synthase
VNPPPLDGKRVLVTRALQQAGKLSDGLRALGAVPVEVPLLEIRPPVSFDPLDAALLQLASYDCLILSSTNAVGALAGRAAFLKLDLEKAIPPRVVLAAIGKATAAAASKVGLAVTFVPVAYVAESLIDGLCKHFHGLLEGKKFLLARAETARDVIPEALCEAGAIVDVVDAYRNVMPENAPELLCGAIAEGLDFATFTSSSSVTHLQEAARRAGISWPLSGVKAVSIGPVTSQTLRDSGWEPVAEADPHDIPGLLAALPALLGS